MFIKKSSSRIIPGLIFLLVSPIIFSYVFSSCASSKVAEEKPLWVDDVKAVYPETEYIARVGQGFSKKEALDDAEVQLGKFFGQNVKAETSATEVMVNGTAGGYNNKEIVNKYTISLDNKLFGVENTKPWYDKDSDLYYICAFINKEKATELYKSVITKAQKDFLNIYNKALVEEDYFKKISLIKDAEPYGTAFIDTLTIGQLLDPTTYDFYRRDMDKVSNLKEMMASAKLYTSMKVFVDNDIDGKISAIVSEVISDNGFVLASRKNSKYNYTVDVILSKNTAEDDTYGIISANPSISIEIINNINDEVLYSYSADFDRVSAYSLRVLNNNIFKEIETNLKDNFSNDFSKFIKNR